MNFPARMVEKLWLKVLFADLLWEKNTTEWLADLTDKLKWTGESCAVVGDKINARGRTCEFDSSSFHMFRTSQN